MGIDLNRRPWSAIVVAVCGLAMIVGATFRLGELPFGRHRSAAMSRDPASTAAGQIGLLFLALAAWLARSERNLEDENDPADDPITRLDESDPLLRPRDAEKQEESK
jgi:hypothetical protein